MIVHRCVAFISIFVAPRRISIEQIDQKNRTIYLQPAVHRDRGFVCWWYFKVEGITPGEQITLDVGRGPWATPDRAAFSLDGKTWKMTEPGQRYKDRIVYRQTIDQAQAWFAWGPPYVLADAEAAIQRWTKKSPYAQVFILTRSQAGRPVPGLRVAQPGVPDRERFGVWVQARQHAWEAGSSWVCQGFTDWLLSDDAMAERLRKVATITIIPIMDVDNVEIGAGGKMQKPHDHNRDWGEDAYWPEVRAAMNLIREQAKANRFDLFVDLHNPDAHARQPYFGVPYTGLLSSQARSNQAQFLALARKEMSAPFSLVVRPRESGPAYDANWQRMATNWVTKNTGSHVVAVCLETPWNTPFSNVEGYCRVGQQLGRAIAAYTSAIRPQRTSD
jgi:hypothetical protein